MREIRKVREMLCHLIEVSPGAGESPVVPCTILKTELPGSRPAPNAAAGAAGAAGDEATGLGL